MKNKNENIYFQMTMVNMYSEVKTGKLYSIEDVDELVEEINSDHHWNVQKIERFEKHEFVYEKEIIHKALGFSIEKVTENDNINDINLSFLVKDENLRNIKRRW